MPFYERGNVRIHYEETGSGYPLLIIPGGARALRIVPHSIILVPYVQHVQLLAHHSHF